MKIIIKPSFERIYKKLPHVEKIQIDDKIRELFNYYNKDMAGKDDYFEIDTASNRRILIKKQKSIVELIAYGNHDEIRRLLKQM